MPQEKRSYRYVVKNWRRYNEALYQCSISAFFHALQTSSLKHWRAWSYRWGPTSGSFRYVCGNPLCGVCGDREVIISTRGRDNRRVQLPPPHDMITHTSIARVWRSAGRGMLSAAALCVALLRAQQPTIKDLLAPMPPDKQLDLLLPYVQHLSDSLAVATNLNTRLRQDSLRLLSQAIPVPSSQALSEKESHILWHLLEGEGFTGKLVVVVCYIAGKPVDMRVCKLDDPPALLPCIILWNGCANVGGVAIAYAVDEKKLSSSSDGMVSGEKGVLVYPNPSRGEVNILLPERGDWKCEIYDRDGVKKDEVSLCGKGSETILLPPQSGVYWLRCSKEGQIWVTKVVRE